jgi:hypothetical protein
LVREANERIRFSINFDARKNQQNPQISNVRRDLSKVKQDIYDLKNDLNSAKQPLMVIKKWNKTCFFIPVNFSKTIREFEQQFGGKTVLAGLRQKFEV